MNNLPKIDVSISREDEVAPLPDHITHTYFNLTKTKTL